PLGLPALPPRHKPQAEPSEPPLDHLRLTRSMVPRSWGGTIPPRPARATALVELRDLEGVGAGIAGSAEEGVLDDEDLRGVLRPERVQDVGVDLDVVLADPPAAEPAGSHRGALAVPAVHGAFQ